MRRTLLDANFHQTEAGLITVERLLVSLGEAWARISESDARASLENQPLTPAVSLPWGMVGEPSAPARHWSA
jgi:hypothetical protein